MSHCDSVTWPTQFFHPITTEKRWGEKLMQYTFTINTPCYIMTKIFHYWTSNIYYTTLYNTSYWHDFGNHNSFMQSQHHSMDECLSDLRNSVKLPRIYMCNINMKYTNYISKYKQYLEIKWLSGSLHCCHVCVLTLWRAAGKTQECCVVMILTPVKGGESGERALHPTENTR